MQSICLPLATVFRKQVTRKPLRCEGKALWRLPQMVQLHSLQGLWASPGSPTVAFVQRVLDLSEQRSALGPELGCGTPCHGGQHPGAFPARVDGFRDRGSPSEFPGSSVRATGS